MCGNNLTMTTTLKTSFLLFAALLFSGAALAQTQVKIASVRVDEMILQSPVYKNLADKMKAEFERQGFTHLFPIRFKEKLVGALLVGEKLSEASFLAEDLSYLAAVSKQASLAIENAFLYEELAEQERLKHELAIARRGSWSRTRSSTAGSPRS